MVKKSTGFLDAVRVEAAASYPGPRCGVKRLLESDLDPVLRGEIIEALQDRSLPHMAIIRALRNRGIVLGRSAVEKHRRCECACDR